MVAPVPDPPSRPGTEQATDTPRNYRVQESVASAPMYDQFANAPVAPSTTPLEVNMQQSPPTSPVAVVGREEDGSPAASALLLGVGKGVSPSPEAHDGSKHQYVRHGTEIGLWSGLGCDL